MKTLKISFLQSTPDFGKEGIRHLLEDRYHIEESDSDFDYLIATPWFYVNREAFYDFLERSPGHLTIMYGCHEAIAPDFMLFDYYIGVDAIPASERTVKLPSLAAPPSGSARGQERTECGKPSRRQNRLLQFHLRQPEIPPQPGRHVPQAFQL